MSETPGDAMVNMALSELRALPPAIAGGREATANDTELNDALDRMRDVAGQLAPDVRHRVARAAVAELTRLRPTWTDSDRRTTLAATLRESDPASPARSIVWLGTAEIFDELAATSWVARGLMIGPGRPALLAGYGASAKTLAAQSLALAVAAGKPVWGFFDVAAPCRVLHFDFEQGEHATRRRYQRLALGHGIDTSELGDRLALAPLPRVFLDAPDASDAFAREFEGAQLAIIDSLRAAAPGFDENDSAVRQALDALTHASAKTGCAVLLIHHAGKTQDRHADARQVARGSSAIFDAAGNVLVISQGKTKTDPRQVAQAKVPAEAEGAPLDDFLLAVEDVAIGADTTAGVRVVHRPTQARDPVAENDAAFERDAERLLAIVRAEPGITQNKIVLKAAMNRGRSIALLNALEDDKRVTCLPGDRGSKTYRTGPR